MQKQKEVTQEEFDNFVESYSVKLEKDVYGAFEPPLVTYNDFSLGVWPESVVAWCKFTHDGKGLEQFHIKE